MKKNLKHPTTPIMSQLMIMIASFLEFEENRECEIKICKIQEDLVEA